jgi:hypothetical protein
LGHKYQQVAPPLGKVSDLDGVLPDDAGHALLERSCTVNIFLVQYQKCLEPWLERFVVYPIDVEL